MENNNNNYKDVCYICHRSEDVAGKMIHIPNNICVCNDCMQKTFDQMSNFGFPNFPGFDFNMNPNQNSTNSNVTNNDADSKPIENTTLDSTEVVADGASNNSDVSVETAAGENISGQSGSDANQNGTGNGQSNNGNNQNNPFGLNNVDLSNVSFLNLGDLGSIFSGMPNQQRVKKSKKKEESDIKPVFDINHIPHPHEIKATLDDYVVGQDQAKKVMSVAVYNHYKRVATNTMDEIEIEKSNILMLGPTGSGKTYMVRTLARLLDVPLAIADATSLTEAGYIGDDIESVLSKLLAAADNDVDRAETGIVFIDEIDKLAKKKNTNQRDVSGEAVQQGMLKLLEGAEIEVPVGASSKNAMVPMTTINTRNILFICGGAFPDLAEIIKERLNKSSAMGFVSDLKDKYDADENILSKVTVEDLRKFGMIPEFIGRLPVICALDALSEDMLVRILSEPKNAITKQYQKLLELDEVKLVFDEGALRAIAKKARERELGARALRAIIEEFMLDIMFEVPKDDNIGTVTITEDYVNGKGAPIITMRETERLPKPEEKAIESEN